MSEINFYIPKDETIPTDLGLYVDDVCVIYKRIDGSFAFHVLLDKDDAKSARWLSGNIV